MLGARNLFVRKNPESDKQSSNFASLLHPPSNSLLLFVEKYLLSTNYYYNNFNSTEFCSQNVFRCEKNDSQATRADSMPRFDVLKISNLILGTPFAADTHNKNA